MKSRFVKPIRESYRLSHTHVIVTIPITIILFSYACGLRSQQLASLFVGGQISSISLKSNIGSNRTQFQGQESVTIFGVVVRTEADRTDHYTTAPPLCLLLSRGVYISCTESPGVYWPVPGALLPLVRLDNFPECSVLLHNKHTCPG